MSLLTHPHIVLPQTVQLLHIQARNFISKRRKGRGEEKKGTATATRITSGRNDQCITMHDRTIARSIFLDIEILHSLPAVCHTQNNTRQGFWNVRLTARHFWPRGRDVGNRSSPETKLDYPSLSLCGQEDLG